jgi:hypothetical protein
MKNAQVTLEKAKVQVFSASGKFKNEYLLEILPSECTLNNNGTFSVNMSELTDRIRKEKSSLIDVGYYFHVTHPDGYPCLVFDVL